MSKKITAFFEKSNEARVACTVTPDESITVVDSIQCEADIHTFDAHFMHYGEDKHYRPYMIIHAMVNSIKGNFPENVGEVKFPSDKINPKVTYKYDFSEDELAELVLKGMYKDGFRVPDIFIDNDWSLPLMCNCSYIMAEKNIPIMIIGIQNSTGVEINSATAGYGNLSQYFEIAREKSIENDGYMSDYYQSYENESDYDYDNIMHDEDYNKTEPEPEVQEEVRELTPEEKDMQQHLENIGKHIEDKRSERGSAITATENIIKEMQTGNESDFNDYFHDDDEDDDIRLDNDIFNIDSNMSMDDRLKAMAEMEKNKKEKQKIAQGDIKEAVAEETLQKRQDELQSMDGFLSDNDIPEIADDDIEF